MIVYKKQREYMHVMWECFVLMIPNIWYVYCNFLIGCRFVWRNKEFTNMLLLWSCMYVESRHISMKLFIHTFRNMAVTFFSESSWGRHEIFSLKAKDRQLDSIVITGGIVSCHYDKLRCHLWRQICQIGDLLFSVSRIVTVYSHMTQHGHKVVIWGFVGLS